ncbi:MULTISPECIES: M61 family peptidase [unclassified Pseudoalteromonas]|uniref:M61 family metallopeptidase n=1 Tax=unclassified Pseudoalteromonas TaxID=194690 RepID=UPI0020984A16|nr:M61 family peptidase [Pseudoalteromonas sp. XMcav2-N]MCO7187672.1 M61 family peptidase [Pseudoalteromonas sp. XMcav2-N]
MKKTCSLLIALSAFPAFADVEYTLTITEPEHHLGEVEITFPKSAQAHMDIKLADWRTGRYEILDLANGIRAFDAADANGQELEWHKVDKSTWRVHLDSPTEVTVNYQVYANELGLRARHIDDSHAFVDASGFFMFSESFRNEPVLVQMKVPEQWRSVSGMEFAGNKHRFSAANFDVLVDSPIESGINQLHSFRVDDRDYELVIWGEGNYDVDLMLSDLKKLVQTGSLIWQDYPYERYVFMVHATSGARGATEHLNSTIIQRHRDAFAKRDDYIGFISTAAHEFIHTWNVKNYRPAGLVPYDYVNPNYTDLLWLSEGSTSYLEDFLLLSAGIITHEEYYKGLTKRLNRHLKTPGREIQSVAQTSFDKWINQGGDHGKNFSTNIYSEGAIVSMMLDIKLLDDSDGKVSYRDVHSILAQRHSLPESFNSQDVLKILNEISGKDYTQWWEKNIDTPFILDVDTLIEKVGLAYQYPAGSQTIAGFDGQAKSNGELLELSHVARNGNAWQAGLTSGDKLVALNKHQVRNTLDKTMALFEPGQKVVVDFIRRDKLMSAEMTLSEVQSKPKQVTALPQPTQRQQMLYRAWMGVPHPNAGQTSQ